MSRFALPALAALLAIFADLTSASADTKVAYSCDNGVVIVADFGMSEGRVALTYGKRRVALAPVPSSTGPRKYTNDKVTFWTDGKTARLSDSGKEIACKVIED